MVQELRGLAQEMQATDRKFAHFCRAGVKVAERAGPARGHAIATGIARMAIKQSKEGEPANQRSSKLFGNRRSWQKVDYYGLLPAADLWGLTEGKFDHSTEFRGPSVTFVHMEVRSVAGVRLLLVNSPRDT